MAAQLTSPLDLLQTHLRNSSEIASDQSREYQRTMAFRRLTEDSSQDSIEDEELRNKQPQKVAILAVPPPTSKSQPPVQGLKAKPVTLAEIRANLARKRSMEAKKRQQQQMEASRQSISSFQCSDTSDRPPSAHTNPLLAGIKPGSEIPVFLNEVNPALSPYPSSSPISSESSLFPSSQESQTGKHSPRTKKQPSIPRSSVWPSNIEYISNRPSNTQPVNVPASTLSNAGWDVIPIALSSTEEEEARRIGPTFMRPEAFEEESLDHTPLSPTKISTLKQASQTIEQTNLAIREASLLAEEQRRQNHLSAIAKNQAELDELLQRRANSEDALLKLYDYFDGEKSPLPQRDDLNATTMFDDPKDLASSLSIDLPMQDSPISINPPQKQLPPPLPEKSTKKKVVHFAPSPKVIGVTPFDNDDDEKEETPEESRQRRALPSQRLDWRDQNAYQCELSVIQKVRGDSYQDHQWSSSDSDADLIKPIPPRKKSFKDMLWR